MEARFYLQIMELNGHVCLAWPCVASSYDLIVAFYGYQYVWPCVALFCLAWPCLVLHGLFMALYGRLWQNIVFSRGHRSKFILSCFTCDIFRFEARAVKLIRGSVADFILVVVYCIFWNCFWTPWISEMMILCGLRAALERGQKSTEAAAAVLLIRPNYLVNSRPSQLQKCLRYH